MPRVGNNRLNVLAVQRARNPGLYGDGNNLYLRVDKGGSKSWVLRFMLCGRARTMGLGSISIIPLAMAREKAIDCKRLLLAGKDPINEIGWKALRVKQAVARGNLMTFSEAAAKYIEAHSPGWKNAKHRYQWEQTITSYAVPVLGQIPVAEVSTPLVLRVLEPIWASKTETASRLRNRIELVWDWSKARGYCSGDNPARWKGHLDKILPKRSKVCRVEHHKAVPVDEIGAFIARLREIPSMSAKALEFCILTATRTSETLGARWEEIDLLTRVWTIPTIRMKAGKEHRVPLSDRAIEILNCAREMGPAEFAFPGEKEETLSNMSMLMVLRRMKVDAVVHGFRSSFRDWGGERTSYPREVIEAALAHGLQNKVEAAYARGDLFLKRQRLMADWAEFCSRIPSEVATAAVIGIGDRMNASV